MKRSAQCWILLIVVSIMVFTGGAIEAKDEGNRFPEWKVKKIVIEGNNHYSDKQIRGMMNVREGKEFRQWQLDEDLELIGRFYRKHGFVDFSVSDVKKEVDVRKSQITLKISLSEGPRTLFRKIHFEGNRFLSDVTLRDEFGLKRGKPFRPEKVDNLLRYITDHYSDKGYINLKVNSRSEMTASGDSIDVYLTFDEGSRVHVGRVSVVGNDKVDGDIVLKGSRLKRGEIITPRRLQESQQSIYQTGLFKNVSFKIEKTARPDTADVLITVRESDFKTLGFGSGYGSVDGIKASIEWNQHHIFSGSESIQTKSEVTYQPFELSRIRFSNTYATAFTQPFFLGTLVRAQWSLSYALSEYLTYEQEIVSFKGMFTRIIGVFKRFSILADMNSTRIFNVDEDKASNDVILNEGRQISNSLTATFVLDKRKDLFYPEEKDFLTVESTLSGGPLYGDVNFYRVDADYARYARVPGRFLRPVIAARLRLGVIKGFKGTGSILPGEQFSIGGANTLRGYKEESIGPLGEEGDPNTHSGNYIVLFNLEGRFNIWHKIGGVLFFDSGNVYDSDFKPRSPFLLTTFGMGVRYRSPIGPIRLEGALRIDSNLSLRSGVGRVHFSVGQAF